MSSRAAPRRRRMPEYEGRLSFPSRPLLSGCPLSSIPGIRLASLIRSPLPIQFHIIWPTPLAQTNLHSPSGATAHARGSGRGRFRRLPASCNLQRPSDRPEPPSCNRPNPVCLSVCLMTTKPTLPTIPPSLSLPPAIRPPAFPTEQSSFSRTTASRVK